MSGNVLLVDTLHVVEGDVLKFSVTFGGQPLPTPVTFWWPDGTADGKVKTLELGPGGYTAYLFMTAPEVDQMIADLAREPRKRPQVDLATLRTLRFRSVVVQRTDRPNALEEA